MNRFSHYRYSIDANDLIVSVSDRWLAFAQENGAPELARQFVIGKALWDFIAGEETRQLYQGILSKLRRTDRRVVVPFRCDSPTLRRHMRLEITATADTVYFDSLLVRVEPRAYAPLLDNRLRRSDNSLYMCSCCKRVCLEPRGWMEPEDAVARLNLFDAESVPKIVQSICPLCAAVVAKNN